MRVAWLGAVAALAAASVPVVAWACYSGPIDYPESLRLELKSVTVGGTAADMSAYEGYEVWIESDGGPLQWSAQKEGDSYHAWYGR